VKNPRTGGSLTALPIIETQLGDVSAYIPTNVISITDGQLFLETDLFNAGIRPAINVGISVSRVGGDAQTRAMKQVASRLKLDLAQFRELQAFATFGSDVDKTTLQLLERGRRMTELLKQKQYDPRPLWAQVVAIFAGTNGYLDKIPVNRIQDWEQEFIKYIEMSYPDIVNGIMTEKRINDANIAKLRTAIELFNKTFN